MGRLIGISGLLWLVVAANVLVLHGFGFLSQSFGGDFAEPIDGYSIFNLLVLDTPSTLLSWGAVVIFLSSVFKQRLLVIVVSLLAMLAYYFVVLNSPFALLPIVSPLSNHSLYISDIVPELASMTTLLMRIASAVAALLLIVLATMLTHRSDENTPQSRLVLASVLVVLTGVFATIAVSHTTHKLGQVTKWREYHDSYGWNGAIDVTKISGEVNIDPRKNLQVDLTYSFNVVSQPDRKLVFTFNPSMAVRELSVNEQPTEFSFKHGLLEVFTPELLHKESTHTLRIKAEGIPNPRFTQFNSALNYQTDPTIAPRTVKIFGTDGSIFRPEYVGLLPGVYWYPNPGALRSTMTSGNAINDYFDVELTVELVRQHWDLIASGSVPEYIDGVYRVVTQAPVSQIGLLASNFERVSLNVEGIEFSIVLHRRHVRNLVLAKNLDAAIAGNIQFILNPLSEHGLTYPSNYLSMVEVPSRLRMVDGGWRMDVANTLPGVVLLKEHGYPTAPIQRTLRKEEEFGEEYGYSERQVKGGQVRAIWRLFQDSVGTDSPWSTFPHRYWTQVTAASGDYAPVLNQVVLYALSQPLITWDFFSIHSTLYVADMVVLNPITGYFTADPLGHIEGFLPLLHRLGSLEAPFGNRPSVWEHAETNSLDDLPSEFGSLMDVEYLLFKCAEIAKGLEALNGQEKMLIWLADVRNTYSGTTFTYKEMLELAAQHDLIVDPFLTDWISSKELPGYVYSSGTQVQIDDDEQGNARFQSTVEVRNVQPVAGYIQFLYRDRTAFDRSPGVLIEANSSKRINIVTSNRVESLNLLPGLSLNRGSRDISIRLNIETEQLDEQPAPLVEESDWTPIPAAGLVVDDLDPGFQVFQENPKVKRSNMPTYLGGLFEPRLEVELDYGLPIWTPYREDYFPSTWYREESVDAFGAIRRTFARAWVRGDVPRVRFSAEIPAAGRWLLEYHIPYSGDTGAYNLELSNSNETSNFRIVAGSMGMGWNSIRTFDLQEGTVHLDVSSAPESEVLYADAIRWTEATTD